MPASLGDAARAAAWDEIAEQLRSFETAGHFVGPCVLLVGAGTA
jgi:hypothetical protein